MTILVTNDDGVNSAGLRALSRAMGRLGEVWVVAPEEEKSAASHSLTIAGPLQTRRVGERTLCVQGTPTDCVLIAVHAVLGRRPDLLVSGINQGPNLGDDVTYSGTVAAALEGALLSIPSIAISLVSESEAQLGTAASFACLLAEHLKDSTVPAGVLLNVNVPDLPREEVKGVEVTRLGRRTYADVISEKRDSQGGSSYLIRKSPPAWEERGEGTDFAAVQEGKISITPLRIDMTDHSSVSRLNEWARNLQLLFAG